MMLSMTNRAAACAAGLMLSGCMQSLPSAELVTRPTHEAFARLASWTPWRPQAEPAPIVLQSEEITSLPTVPLQTFVPASELPRQTGERKPRAAIVTARAPRAAPAVSRRPNLLVPVSATVSQPAALSTDPLPGRLSCQTESQPGVRVSMQCHPID